MAPVADFCRGKAFFNHAKGGWSEQYDFNTTDPATAKALFNTVLNYRSTILASGIKIVRASLSRMKVLRDSIVPVGYTKKGVVLVAETEVPTCNTLSSGLLVRFDTGQGKWVNKLFRGIRDSWIDDVVTALGSAAWQYITLPLATPAIPAFGTSYSNSVKAVLTAIANSTAFMKAGLYQLNPLPAAKTAGWDPLSFARIQFVRVAEHDTGRGYSLSRGRKKAKI